jgi:hypothetical protein
VINLKINNLIYNRINLNYNIFSLLNCEYKCDIFESPEEPTTMNLFEENMEKNIFDSQNLLRSNGISQEEIDEMMNFILNMEKLYVFLSKDKIFNNADDLYASKLQDFIDLLKFKKETPTELAMRRFLFKPIRKLFNDGEEFKINTINQWKLEKLYKVMNYNKSHHKKFTKKKFMLMINKVANENVVDSSFIRFNSQGCISLSNKLCPIPYKVYKYHGIQINQT